METTQSILVLDDDPSLGEFIAAAAENVGLRCVFTTDPNVFLELISPDLTLVMVDLVMPHVDGVEILRLLAKRGCNANVVLMSGLGQRVIETAERLAITLGLSVLGHLRKPIRLVDLEEVFASPRLSAGVKIPPRKIDALISDEDLKSAIARNEFINHYQPQVSLPSGDVVGVEALVRWQHPVHGLIFPDTFIPRLESLGLMNELGLIVCRTAFFDIKRFANAAQFLPGLAINITAQALQDLAFPDVLGSLAREFGVDERGITLEITEGGLVRGLSTTLDVLTRLRMKQFELSIDDFGTGYSMMQQLNTIPATELKIDKSFVMNIDHSESDRIVVTKSIEIGHALGMRVVAEGVESLEQFEFIRDHGCDVAQGYLISRPKPVSELVVWLEKYRTTQLFPSPMSILNSDR